MTHDERVHLLTQWQAHALKLEAQWHALRAMTGAAIDSPLGEAVWSALDGYTNALAQLVGSPPSGVQAFAHDLAWYAWENDFGRKGHEAGVKGDTRAIRTPGDLAWLIELLHG